MRIKTLLFAYILSCIGVFIVKSIASLFIDIDPASLLVGMIMCLTVVVISVPIFRISRR